MRSDWVYSKKREVLRSKAFFATALYCIALEMVISASRDLAGEAAVLVCGFLWQPLLQLQVLVDKFVQQACEAIHWYWNLPRPEMGYEDF